MVYYTIPFTSVSCMFGILYMQTRLFKKYSLVLCSSEGRVTVFTAHKRINVSFKIFCCFSVDPILLRTLAKKLYEYVVGFYMKILQ